MPVNVRVTPALVHLMDGASGVMTFGVGVVFEGNELGIFILRILGSDSDPVTRLVSWIENSLPSQALLNGILKRTVPFFIAPFSLFLVS